MESWSMLKMCLVLHYNNPASCFRAALCGLVFFKYGSCIYLLIIIQLKCSCSCSVDILDTGSYTCASPGVSGSSCFIRTS